MPIPRSSDFLRTFADMGELIEPYYVALRDAEREYKLAEKQFDTWLDACSGMSGATHMFEHYDELSEQSRTALGLLYLQLQQAEKRYYDALEHLLAEISHIIVEAAGPEQYELAREIAVPFLEEEDGS